MSNIEFKKSSHKLSIGICTANDEQNIISLLKNLIKIFSFNSINTVEIIFVSSGCSDKTEKIIKYYINKFPTKIHLFTELKRNGKSAALNIIFNNYKGNALLLMPADVVVNPKSILFIVRKLFSDENIGVVSGRPIIHHNGMRCNAICKMVDLLWKLHNHSLNLNKNTHATGELMILRKNVIKRIPPIIINDDAWIALEAAVNNYDISYEKRAKVIISIPIQISDYINQRKRIILGHKQLKRIRNSKTSNLKEIFFKNKKIAFRLLYFELKHLKNVPYFLLALVLEAYIEFIILFEKNLSTKEKTVWKRVNTINSSI